MIVVFVYALGIVMLLADGALEYNETETAFLDEPSSLPDSLEPCRGNLRENRTKVAQVCSWRNC